MTNLNLASLEKMDPEVRKETYEPSKGRYIAKAEEPTWTVIDTDSKGRITFNVYQKRPEKTPAYNPMQEDYFFGSKAIGFTITEDFIFPSASTVEGTQVESLPKSIADIQSIGRALRSKATREDLVVIEELADIAREYNINIVTSKPVGLADIEVETAIAKPRQLKANWTIDPIGKLDFDTDFELN